MWLLITCDKGRLCNGSRISYISSILFILNINALNSKHLIFLLLNNRPPCAEQTI